MTVWRWNPTSRFVRSERRVPTPMPSSLRPPCLVIAAVLAGGSAAITTAGGVMDRRRTFGALIAAGTPVRVLARALRTEAALPAFITTIGAGAVGTFAGIGLFLTASPHGNPVLSPWILVPIALGVLVAALGGVICRPVLNQIAAEPLSDE